MATTMSISRTRALPSVKVQAAATLAAIVGAVAIPQIFHVVGAIFGMGTGLSPARAVRSSVSRSPACRVRRCCRSW